LSPQSSVLQYVPFRPAPGGAEIVDRRRSRDLLPLVAVEKRDEIELLVGRAEGGVEVARDFVRRERGAAEDLDEREADAVALAAVLVGAVDQLAADELRVGLEVEIEIVGTAGVVKRAGDGDGLVALARAGTKHRQGIGGGRVLDRREYHAGRHRLDHAREVAVRLLLRER